MSKKARWLARSTLVVASTAIALVASEFLVRATPLARARDEHVANEPWLKTDFYRMVPGRGFEIIPRATPEISNLGMRGKDRTEQKPAGTFRVLVLGDSVTYGCNVGVDETYSAQLEKLLAADSPQRPVEVLNAGVSGYNTIQELHWLRERGYALDPDVVVLGICPNDAMVTPIVFKDGDQFRWYRPGNEEALYNQFLIQHSLLFRLTLTVLAAKGRDAEAARIFDRDGNYAAMRAMALELNEKRIPFVAIVFPYLADPFDKYPAHVMEFHGDVHRILTETSTPFVDLLAEWQGIPPERFKSPSVPNDWVHPNAVGHFDAARHVANMIRRIAPAR